MSGVLDGLKVVSLEQVEAIPAASVWLADWGADVIKVEPPTGELSRGTLRVGGVSTSIKVDGGKVEINPGFHLLNRNKKSIAVDLKKEPGRQILYQLVKRADVFMSNIELNALEKLKVDYDTLSQFNPRLIYAFFSAYGTAGPEKDSPGYDRVAAWARAGFQYMIGEPGSIPPLQRSGVMDRTAAPHVVAGVLGALLHREKTGKGQKLEISLYHSAVWTLARDIQSALMGQTILKDDRSKATNPLWNIYRTKDGRWLCLGMFRPDPYWHAFCQAIEKPELEKDPRFNNMETRTQNREELIRILDKVFMCKTIDEWEKRCREHRLIYSRVQSPEEVTTDPQALANSFFVDLPDAAGQMQVVASPVKFCQNPASVRAPAPELGQHTEEVLLELGYSWEDMAQLKEQGVII